MVPLDFRLQSLGRAASDVRPTRSSSLSDDIVDDVAESGIEAEWSATAVELETRSAMDGRGMVSEEEDRDILVAAMIPLPC